MPLYEHQKTGADWLATRTRGCLWDVQGLGKTITALEAAKKLRPSKTLIVVPAAVLWNWKRETDTWFPGQRIWVIDSGVSEPDGDYDVAIVAHALILNEDLRARLQIRWDLLIVDEAHYFKSHTAQRTHVLYGKIVPYCYRVWLLTGTPMPNNCAELWPMFYGVWPRRIPSRKTDGPMGFEEFRDTYCVTQSTPWGVKVVGHRNQEHLKKALAGIALRRTKNVIQLPPRRIESMVVSPDSATWDRASTRVSDETRWLVEALRDGTIEFEEIRNAELAQYRQLCGLAKVSSVAAIVAEELAADKALKAVVFVYHIEVLDAYLTAFGRAKLEPLGFHGGIPPKIRQDFVDEFQTNPECRVMVCQIQAGGVGITLTAASEVVVAEYPWVPGELAQAIDRCHRIGQDKTVRVRYMSLANSLDEYMTAAIRKKVGMISDYVDT